MDISEHIKMVETHLLSLQPSCATSIQIFARDKKVIIRPASSGKVPGSFIAKLSPEHINKGLTSKEWEALRLKIYDTQCRGLLL